MRAAQIMMDNETNLIFAALFFIISHIGLASEPMRGVLVKILGRNFYLIFFSVISALAMIWLIVAFITAPPVEIWSPPQELRLIPLAVMPFACILFVTGISTSKATVLSDGALTKGTIKTPGILRITRHPIMWGFALWGLSHMAANGNQTDLILFGMIVFLALAGMKRLDTKHRKTQGAAFEEFAAKTSLIPFAAILSGRNKLALKEINKLEIAGGLALYAALLTGHEWVIGVTPLPHQWAIGIT